MKTVELAGKKILVTGVTGQVAAPVVTALALLLVYGRIFNGPLPEQLRTVRDVPLAGREFLAAAPLIVALIALGVYPALILDLVNATATALAAVFARGVT